MRFVAHYLDHALLITSMIIITAFLLFVNDLVDEKFKIIRLRYISRIGP